MAVTDQQKLDFLLKKIGYTKTKTGSVVGTGAISGTPKQPFAEAIPSPLVVPNASLWNEADSIPATAPGSDTTQVKVYLAATSGLRMTADATSSGQRAYIAYSTYNNTSSARLTNWIDTQFGASYLIKVYKGDPNSGGVALSAAGSGSNDGWFFDYSAGVLNFNDTNVPSGVTDTNIYIVGYRYIGQTGAPTSGISTFSFKDLTVERNLDVGVQGGISTFSNAINAVDIIKGYKYFAAPYSGTTTTLTVTVASKVSGQHRYHGQGSGLGYVIDGLQSPFFTLTPGNTYRFDQSDNSNSTHQIKFYLEADKTTLYEEGVTYNGTAGNSGAYTQIVVGDETPVVLHYQCINHGYMGNAVQVNSNVVNTNYNALLRGDLDVDGHTNLDNVSIVGVATVNGEITFPDYSSPNNRISFGDSQDLKIWHTGNNGHINNSTGALYIQGTPGNNYVYIAPAGGGAALARFDMNGSGARLYSNGATRLLTRADGVRTYGTLEAANLNVTGVSTFAGDATFSGNVSIGGTLTYEDVTNIDSVGIVTARAGLKVLAGGADIVGVVTATGADINGDIDVDGHTNLDNVSIAGVTTTTDDIIIGADNKKLKLGVGEELQLYQTGNHSIIQHHGSHYLSLRSNAFNVMDAAGSKSIFSGFLNSHSSMYYNGSYKIRTQNTGAEIVGTVVATGADINGDIDVDGHTNLDNVSIAGVSTFTGAIDANGDLDVDGHTELDNVNVSGIITSAAATVNGETILNGNVSFYGASYGAIWRKNNNRFTLNDNAELTFGNNNDTTIKHNNSHLLITNTTGNIDVTGNVLLNNDLDVDGHTELDNVNIVGVTTHQGHVLPSADSTYDLGSSSKYWRHVYADNVTGGGGGVVIGDDIITRNLQVNGISTHVGIATFNDATFHDDVTFDTANGNDILFDKSDNSLKFGDSVRAKFGASTDMEIYHTTAGGGTNFVKGTGNLTLQSNVIVLEDQSGNDYIRIDNGGAVKINHPGSTEKLRTTSTGVQVTGLTDTDTFLSSGNATFSGTITAGGGTGTNGQYLKTTGSGVAWASFPTLRSSQTFTASAGQTTFSFTYTVGLVDVFVNGIKLSTSEFTANNGSSVVLAVGCFVGDIVELNGYNTVSAGGGASGIGNVVEDTTPQLGGNLDLFNKTITGTGNINITGVATATKFVGDGSGLTGVIASGTGIIIKNSGSTVGTAGTINFGDNLSVSALSGGAVTVSASAASTAEVRANTLTVAGISTFSDDIQIPFDNKKLIVGADDDLELFHTGGNSVIKNTTSGSLLIHGDAIDLRPTTESGEVMLRATRNGSVELRHDNVKKFETRAGGATVSGTINATGGSFTGNLRFANNVGTLFGASDELQVYHNNGTSYISHNGSGQLQLRAKHTEHGIKIFPDGAVELYHDNVKRLETSAQGIEVTGHSELDNVNIAGVVTATTFKGAIEATSGTFSSNVTIDAGTNTTLTVEADTAGVALFKATGGSGAQATAALELIQGTTSQQGGGISYNGDGSPAYASGETADHVTFFRMQNGNRTEVFSYPYNSNDVVFNGTVTATTFTGNLSGTVNTATQTNITRVGTLTQLSVSGGTDPVSFTHTGGNCVKFNRSGKTVSINANYAAGNSFSDIGLTSGMDLKFSLGGTHKIVFKSAGHIEPETDSQINLGSTTKRFANVYADNFVGDGSGLTGITASGSGIVIKHDGNTVGTAGTINFGTNLDVSALSGGSVTITASGGSGSGISTISGVVNIVDDLDVDGHTNLDNVSIAGVTTTARLDINSTTPIIDFLESDGNPDYRLYAESGEFIIREQNPSVSNRLVINSTGVSIPNDLDVDGHTNLDNVSIAGVCTASSFVGDGSGLTGVADNVGITTNLSGTFTASAGSPSTINTFGYGSGDIVVEYTVFIKNGSNFQSQKLLAMRDGTTIHSTQFAVMYSSSLLVQLDATISSGNILLRATPETGVSGSTTYKVKREVM